MAILMPDIETTQTEAHNEDSVCSSQNQETTQYIQQDHWWIMNHRSDEPPCQQLLPNSTLS